MKTKVMFCTIVFLLFVFASISFGATESANTFFGNGAGVTTNPASDLKDTFIGTGAGYTNSTGTYNTFVGAGAGYFGNGSWNTFVGGGAGVNNTASYNTFMGAGAGNANTTGAYNTFMGYGAGNISALGVHNTFVGAGAGRVTNGTGVPDAADSGSANTFVGSGAGYSNTTGTGNMFLGYGAGYTNTTGYRNTYLGSGAGNLSTGTGNVFIGMKAGYNETGSNKLYIANNETSTPLLYGEFDNYLVKINGKLIMAEASMPSDLRYKKNIEPLRASLDKITHLKGVSYEWKTEENKGRGFSKGRQIGLIAQDVEAVIPELVYTDDKGYKSLAYDKLVPVLVEAVKEQQGVINGQAAQIKELKEKLSRLDKLEAKISRLESRNLTVQK